MTYVTYLTIPVVTQDELSQNKQNRLAREAAASLNVMIDPEEYGVVKVQDLDYEVPEPFGHTHFSTENQMCNEGERSCINTLRDEVHPTDNN